LANGLVYSTAYDGELDAFDAMTGTGKWSYQIGTGTGNTSPAVSNGVVYAGLNGALYAFDANVGTKLWSTPAYGLGIAPPVVANGIVYDTGGSGTLFAFDATTGAQLWYQNVGAFDSLPAVANGVIFIYSSGSELLAFNATTGSELWASAPTGLSTTVSSAAVANGVVYIAASMLYAFSATTGTLLWSANINNGSRYASPAVANGAVYESSSNGSLLAFNATTGAPMWSATTGTAGGTSPAVANGVVYVGGSTTGGAMPDGTLYAFNATTGTQLWSSASVLAYPVVANGVVYDDSGGIRAYSLPVSGAGLTVSPTFAPDYGTVLDGTSSPPTTFTVTNFGSSPTSAINDTLTGADPLQFRVTSDTCAGIFLAGGASCTIGVSFAPTLSGLRQATLAVSAATGGSTSATLSGTGG
jgi:outer membrane protein assembly factor BamB